MPRRSPTAGGLRRLQVINRLEVAAARVEPRRLVATYQVFKSGQMETFELSYVYEEEVFEPEDPASRNLAQLIASQVALNYGLFCEELALGGPLDRHDRRFLTEMARNTAREIYVNKLLTPNPFIDVEALGDLPAKKLDDFLLARMVFDEPAADDRSTTPRWPLAAAPPDPERYGVLSSGGKESLLSHGLLSELGRTVDPVFINESGGHWTTALRAHRHFKARVPGTARVWTNADRAFSWMLRALPFVRQDRDKIRADVYPVRLWTVAVFSFGALPLLLKRGAGRLVIGDEHDTTRRVSYMGIPHYDGLYDQSRYFDGALSRFYRRKGYGLVQLSILRPLSELLVQKVLVERYPDLQRLQVSCHSAHKEGEEVRPCGRCEKCRRVVAMLTALQADPRACGYSAEQVARCLKDLEGQELHQEQAVTEQVGQLLSGEHERPPIGEVRPRPRPEVLQLRFDGERSPLDGIPLALRRPLYDLLLEHADGAVKRAGRRWVALDLTDEPAMHGPFPFDLPPGEGVDGADAGGADAGGYLLAELTWPRARARFKEVDLALLPVGALEQHGPHLPLDTDTFDADHLCHLVAKACSRPRPMVLPAIPYGVSYHHDSFPGTLSIGPETLSRMVHEIGMAAARSGINKLVIVNGHGGNGPALHFAAQLINRDAKIFTCVESGETSDADVYALVETPNDVHAGEIETSTALATRPELVELAAARPAVPSFSSRYLDFTSKRSVTWYAYTRRISRSGTMGDPTRASADKGARIWAVMVEHLSRFVEQLKGMSLDEIHQRRY